MSKERAIRHQQEQDSISEYKALAQRLMQRGACPEMVLPRGPSGTQELSDAYDIAKSALTDCIRRMNARLHRDEQKLQAQQRKEQFQTWAFQDDIDAYRAFLKRDSLYFNDLQDTVAHVRDKKERVIAWRGAAFKRYQKEWKTCCILAAHKRQSVYWDAQREGTEHVGNRILNIPHTIKLPSFIPLKRPKFDLSQWLHSQRATL